MGIENFDSCMQEVDRCKRLYPGFKEGAPFIVKIYSIIDRYFEENPLVPFPVLEQEEAEARVRAGETLALQPTLETRDFLELLTRFSKALVEVNRGLKKSARLYKERLQQFAGDNPAALTMQDVFRLRDLLIKENVLERDLATFLFSLALASFYRRLLEPISEVLRTDLWEGGNCPLCGERPHFGRFRPEDGAKELECWLCGTGWVHTRIKCPYCDNDEQEELGYFTVEDSEVCRVNFCNLCRRYYKVFDARKFDPDGNMVLTIHNLATLDYDLLAGKEGFTPGSGLEWVEEEETKKRQA